MASSTVGLCRSILDEFMGEKLSTIASVNEYTYTDRYRNTKSDFKANLKCQLPRSPLELESVKLGVPSVHVGVEPSPEAGGVQANPPRDPYWLLDDVSTASSVSRWTSETLKKYI